MQRGVERELAEDDGVCLATLTATASASTTASAISELAPPSRPLWRTEIARTVGAETVQYPSLHGIGTSMSRAATIASGRPPRSTARTCGRIAWGSFASDQTK
jgi:hypothetical protein